MESAPLTRRHETCPTHRVSIPIGNRNWTFSPHSVLCAGWFCYGLVTHKLGYWAETNWRKENTQKYLLTFYHVKICVFQAFANVGFNLISWGLLGELYPTRVAGLAGSITTCMANLMGFAAIKLYPGFQDLVRGDNPTTGGGFFFFGAVSCVAVVFVFLFLPETFNKSLDQVSEEFRQPCGKKVLCR